MQGRDARTESSPSQKGEDAISVLKFADFQRGATMKWIALLIAAIVGTAFPFAITMAITGKSLSAISDWFSANPFRYIFPLLLAAEAAMWANDAAANKGIQGFRPLNLTEEYTNKRISMREKLWQLCPLGYVLVSVVLIFLLSYYR